jgi:hypothetical protein
MANVLQTRGKFLGYVISPFGISMDPSKVKTIVEWKQLTNVKDV